MCQILQLSSSVLFRTLFDIANMACRIGRYIAGLEWTEKKQEICHFCDRDNFRNIVYEVSFIHLHILHASSP